MLRTGVAVMAAGLVLLSGCSSTKDKPSTTTPSGSSSSAAAAGDTDAVAALNAAATKTRSGSYHTDVTVKSAGTSTDISANVDPVAKALEMTMDMNGTKVPLVLMKRGGEVLALNATCSHLGGPLAEGKLVDEWCVECPWHASRFDFRDGSVTRGPAAYPQPKYETRVRDDMVEARLARPTEDAAEQILTRL